MLLCNAESSGEPARSPASMRRVVRYGVALMPFTAFSLSLADGAILVTRHHGIEAPDLESSEQSDEYVNLAPR